MTIEFRRRSVEMLYMARTFAARMARGVRPGLGDPVAQGDPAHAHWDRGQRNWVVHRHDLERAPERGRLAA